MWNRFLFGSRSLGWLPGALLIVVLTALFAASCSGDTAEPRGGSSTTSTGGSSGTGNQGAGGSSSNECPVGSTSCNGSCVNPSIDVMNCGSCGVVCTRGQTCTGTCQCQGGLKACASGCTNTVADGMNCGACGTACGSDKPYCSASQCVATCPGSQVVCGTGCVDSSSFQSDSLNCGKCGNQCAAGQTCAGGSCGCPANQTSCGGACIDTKVDLNNCGMCGKACSGGASCSGGACGCATGLQVCGTLCTDTQTSAANCGKCDAPCTTGQTCTAGMCSTSTTTTTGTGGGGGGTRPAACPAAPSLLSDFEEGTGVLVPQGGRNGWWYVYADTTAGGSQTPASSNMGIAAALLQPAVSDCNKYAMHSTASGHPQYVGFGVTLAPGATPALKKAVSLADYTGISFKIRSGSGTAPPMWFEFLNKETQPGTNCPSCGSGDLSGTATSADIDAFNTRGRLISGITTDWKTVYVPFGTLAPRYLPGDCGASVFCEAPAFNPASTLGLQYSLDMQFNTSGKYDVWVDDVNLTTGDTGLPTLTQATANFPFPVDKALGNGCTKPTGATGKDLVEAYQQWKSTFVTNDQGNLRVKRPESNNDSVSEGIAYGMLIAVNMNDQTLFDGLWAYWKAHPASGLLMTWQIPGGAGSATDADEDAAFALIQASKQWGGSYLTDAKSMLAQVRASDVESGSNALKPGNQFGGASLTNPSYFAPAYYRVFATVDTAGASTWNGVISSTYQFLKSIEGSNGLVPAWCSGSCSSRGGGSYADADKYQYDAHRTPWRMGLDVCWNGNADAKDYVNKVTSFFVSQSSTQGLGALADLYQGNGSKCTACSQSAKVNSMSLIGTAAVGAMATGSAANKAFLDRAWRFLLDANYTADPTFRTGAMSAYTYYNATVGLLTALTLSGNFNSF